MNIETIEIRFYSINGLTIRLSHDFSELVQNVLLCKIIRDIEKRMNISLLLRTKLPALPIRRCFNCWTAAITKKHRKTYMNTYPTHLVFPDGSSIIIDYESPRQIIVLPLDLEKVSPEEREMRLYNRRPRVKVKVEEVEEIDFDETKYYRKRI